MIREKQAGLAWLVAISFALLTGFSLAYDNWFLDSEEYNACVAYQYNLGSSEALAIRYCKGRMR